MSRSYTSRPAVTQGRGRGRGTQTRQVNQPINTGALQMDTGIGARQRVGPSQTSRNPGQRSQTEYEQQPESSDVAQRMTYEGCYTKITPNMKKRQQITDMAAREKESYEAHRQRQTQASFSHVGTAGGGQVTQGEARQKLVQASPNKTQKLLQNQQRKSFVKQKEDEELQKKKEAARQKAVENELKKKASDEAQASRWDEQRRRTNEAFLNRIEARNRQALKGGNTRQASSSERQTTSTEPPESFRHLPPEGAGVGASGETSRSERTREITGPDAGSAGNLTSEQRKAVTAVAAVFPHYPTETLVELLEQVDFSVDSAIMLLSE